MASGHVSLPVRGWQAGRRWSPARHPGCVLPAPLPTPIGISDTAAGVLPSRSQEFWRVAEAGEGGTSGNGAPSPRGGGLLETSEMPGWEATVLKRKALPGKSQMS